MTELFLKLVNMSIAAGWVVIAVLLLRLVFQKAPKWLLCSLWILVAFRLVCPVTFESVLSLIPSIEPVPREILYSATPGQEPEGPTAEAPLEDLPAPVVDMGIDSLDREVNAALAASSIPQVGASVNPLQIWFTLAGWLWLLGAGGMLLYALGSYLFLCRKVRASIAVGDGVFLCDYIDTPFILGIVKPRIYLPSSLEGSDAAYVLAHERAHLHRKDHWWKPAGFLLLSVYWFHPLIWVSYVLLCRDIEMACDEHVVQQLEYSSRAAYSKALLHCSLPRHRIAACPLAFGEVSVKDRVHHVLNYRKPAFWISAVALAAALTAAVCFLTNPKKIVLESPMGKTYLATDLIYSSSGEGMHEISDALLSPITLNDQGICTIGSGSTEALTPITLTEENFDAFLSAEGTWFSHSSQKLRKQTVYAWEIQKTLGVGFYRNSHDFYYVLQQKNGDLYLAAGTWWDAVITPGNTRINWILKLGDAPENTNLYWDAEHPFHWTRLIQYGDVDQVDLSIFTAGGQNADTFSLAQNSNEVYSLVRILNCVKQEEIRLGDPLEQVAVEASILSEQDWERYHVQLRYGDGKVQMVFHEDAHWAFAKTGEKCWIIENQELSAFFARHSQQEPMPEFLQYPPDPYAFAHGVELPYLSDCSIIVNWMDLPYGGYWLSVNEQRELIDILHSLPQDAFTSSSWIPPEAHPHAIWLTVAGYNRYNSDWGYSCGFYRHEGALYLVFPSKDDPDLLSSVWELDSPELLTFIEMHQDPSRIAFRLAPMEMEPITYTHGDISITLMQQQGFEFEIVEYTNEEAPFGIRFRLVGTEGWIFVGYYPNGLQVEEDWFVDRHGNLVMFTSTKKEYHCTEYFFRDQELYGGTLWAARRIDNIDAEGTFAFVNQVDPQWFLEFHSYYDNILSDADISVGSSES